MSSIDVAICSGFSPGARVLRAAVRELTEEEDIRIVTIAPALAELPKAMDEMRSLKERKVIVVDGCEGGCGLQVLNRYEVMPASVVMIKKHFNVTRKGIDEAKEQIRKAIHEVKRMRKGVVVCGANGERGLVLERVTEAFSKDNMSKVIQFSVCTVGLSPIMLEMGGVDMGSIVTVNGCRNRCCDRLMEKNGLKIGTSVTMDDHLERKLGPCELTSKFHFPEPTEEEVKAMVKAMEKAIS